MAKNKVQEAKREMLKPLMQKNDDHLYLINPIWPVEFEAKMQSEFVLWFGVADCAWPSEYR